MSGDPVERFGADDVRDSVAVLAVHGRGQEPAFIRGVAARVADPRAAWFAPRAPGASWYPGRFMDPVHANQPQLDRALDTVLHTLEQIRDAGWSPSRTVLLGFSQGACVLSELMLSAAAPLCAGAVLLTGGFVGPEGTPPPAGTVWTGVPVYCALVESDPWVPLHRARATAQALRERGAVVRWQVFPGDGHEVNDDEVAAAAALLDLVRTGS